MYRKFCIFFLILFPIIIFAQEKQYLFINLDKSNGLSHNHIYSFLRDRKGFIWIGTIEGLCRYDGYSFKIFKNDPFDTTSIRDNSINNLFEDNTGKIWIASGDYFDVFDPETETFIHQQTLLKNRISVPIGSKWFHQFDNNGNIWYANNYTGIYRYITKKDSVQKINFKYNTTNRVI
jgi:ligand-binding sensor domain-containing protein